MDNVFNQFDAAPAAPPIPNTNYGQNIFDQFHPPPAPQGYDGAMPPSPYELQHQSPNPFGQTWDAGVNAAKNVWGNLTMSGQPQQNDTPDLNALGAAANMAPQGTGFIDRAKSAWQNTTAPQKVGAVEEALMTSPPGQIASAVGGTLGNIPSTLVGMANQGLEKFGVPHQYSQAAEMLSPTLLRPAANVLEAARPMLDAIKPTPKPPSGLESDLQNTLINGSPDVRTYQGEQLGNQISEGAQAAKEAKNTAYAAAEEPSKALKISNNVTGDLTDALTKSTEGFNPRVVNNVNGIQDTIDALNKDTKTGQASWARIDQVRQELYNLPKANDAEAKVRANALRAYNDFADNVMQKGIIEGDDNAIKLVRDAHDKNAYWRQKFTGNDANNVIRDYIDKQGGLEQIAPENLLDKFTRVGQAGLDNVKAAKDVLGDSAKPILKHGYLNNIRTASVDANGNINAKKFATQIDTLLTKNPTLVNEVFNESELNALRGAQRESLAYANGKKGQPGILTKLVSKAPVIGPLLEDVMKSRAQSQMINDLSKVTKERK